MDSPTAFPRFEPGTGVDPIPDLRLRGSGAGRRVPDEWDNEGDVRPVIRSQHSFAGEEFEIDTAHNYHGLGDPA